MTGRGEDSDGRHGGPPILPVNKITPIVKQELIQDGEELLHAQTWNDMPDRSSGPSEEEARRMLKELFADEASDEADEEAEVEEKEEHGGAQPGVQGL